GSAAAEGTGRGATRRPRSGVVRCLSGCSGNIASGRTPADRHHLRSRCAPRLPEVVCMLERGEAEFRGLQAAEAQAWLPSIVQSSHAAIVGKSLDGAITSWNPGAERLYGYSAEEMIGRQLDVVIPSDSRVEEAAMLARALKGKRVEDYEARRVHKDGRLIDVSITLSAVADANDVVVGVASIGRDITDRQRANVKLRGLLDGAPDAVLGVGADGRI